MTIQEVWEIKSQKSQVTKNMTTEQLKDYYAASLKEFHEITGKQFQQREAPRLDCIKCGNHP